MKNSHIFTTLGEGLDGFKMVRTTIDFDSETVCTIVQWGKNDFSVRKSERNILGKWDVMDERELSSEMQVYGWLQEMRDASGLARFEADELVLDLFEAL